MGQRVWCPQGAMVFQQLVLAQITLTKPRTFQHILIVQQSFILKISHKACPGSEFIQRHKITSFQNDYNKMTSPISSFEYQDSATLIFMSRGTL